MIILTLKDYEKHIEMNAETFEKLVQWLSYEVGSFPTFTEKDLSWLMSHLPPEIKQGVTTRPGIVGSPDSFSYPRDFKAYHIVKDRELFELDALNAMLFDRMEVRRRYEEARTGLRLYWKNLKFSQIKNKAEGTTLCGVEANLFREMPMDGFDSGGVYYRFEQIRRGVMVPEFEE